jgi:hypothetical protein
MVFGLGLPWQSLSQRWGNYVFRKVWSEPPSFWVLGQCSDPLEHSNVFAKIWQRSVGWNCQIISHGRSIDEQFIGIDVSLLAPDFGINVWNNETVWLGTPVPSVGVLPEFTCLIVLVESMLLVGMLGQQSKAFDDARSFFGSLRDRVAREFEMRELGQCRHIADYFDAPCGAVTFTFTIFPSNFPFAV